MKKIISRAHWPSGLRWGMALISCAAALQAVPPLPVRFAVEIEAVSRWSSGREIYRYACARCHGEDGNWTAYPAIKPLDGIGRRLSEDQIRERLRPVYAGRGKVSVRGHVLQPSDLDMLVGYVSRL